MSNIGTLMTNRLLVSNDAIWCQPEIQTRFIVNLTRKTSKSKYIGMRQQSYRSSHAVPHRIFDDVEERKQGERKRSLPRETTTS
jgi:hypothetical protein